MFCYLGKLEKANCRVIPLTFLTNFNLAQHQVSVIHKPPYYNISSTKRHRTTNSTPCFILERKRASTERILFQVWRVVIANSYLHKVIHIGIGIDENVYIAYKNLFFQVNSPPRVFLRCCQAALLFRCIHATSVGRQRRISDNT